MALGDELGDCLLQYTVRTMNHLRPSQKTKSGNLTISLEDLAFSPSDTVKSTVTWN